MRAMVCQRHGKFDEVLNLQEVPEPPLPAGHLRIAVKAAGLNFADSLITQGKYQHRPDPPFVPGFEIAGEVLEVADGLQGWSPGDRVLAMLDEGGWAEQAIAPANNLHRLPDDMSFVEGAAFPVAYGTSHMALMDRARLASGDVLLVHGAAGGVGLTAVEIGKRAGATVIATAGGPDKLAVAQAAGADHLIDYRAEDIRERVKELTDGRGADVVYDPVGGKTWEASLRCVAPGARMLIIGFAAGEVQQIPANHLLVKNVTAIGFAWTGWRRVDPIGVRDSLDSVLGWGLRPQVARTFPLAEGVAALETLLSRKVTGKVVLEIP
ncbi:NADPH:quinone oxidoreductase family protein [Magnetospira sp. QH-2]|uniref:NADPH:quinone oxidoreductase family protein n=1 Tax=Magnetospira sp. (strain QH-2) TaxID=1288970 RepID=UPI0003E80A85|nr:NADPH:quinone oxidoreductase family protein [Magnetospira sp. QH-2]CCQ72179.1 NADPH quinone oxydoreductase [Magnetospira sp. QH-2]